MTRPARLFDRTTPPHIATLVAVTSVSALSMSVYLPSLPSMTRAFETEYWVMQLSVTLYLVGNAVLQLLVGPLSDRYGRRPVLLWSLALFSVATLGCIFSASAQGFLAFRMLQAVIVAALVLGRAVIRDIHDQEQSAAMIGWVMMGMSVVPLVGPAVGGMLDAAFGWQASFWLLLALGVAMLALAWADQGETARELGRPLTAQIAEYPELLRSPRFWGYALCAAMASGSYFAFLAGAPWVGEHLFDLAPAQVGLGLGVPALGYFFGNFLSARLSVRQGINRMVLAGCLVTAAGIAAGLALFATGHGSVLVFFGLMAAVACGNGMTLPNTIAGSLSVRPALAGSAAGLGGALQIGGGALLATVAGNLLDEETGATPLLILMFASAVGSTLAILYVIARTRALGEPA